MEKFLILLKKKRLLFSIESNFIRRTSFGFTLAEMLVVMLILTIVLAAFAPLMTKRKMVDNTTPWRYATNNSDIYYGLADYQTAMIGQNSKESAGSNSRLIINTSSASQYPILFKSGNTKIGAINFVDNNFLFNTPPALLTVAPTGSYNTAFGKNALYKYTSGKYNVGVGYNSLHNATSSSYNTAVGYNSMQSNATGTSNVAVGSETMASSSSASYNVAVGNKALYSDSGGYNTALGWYAMNKNTSGHGNVAIGYAAMNKNETGNDNIAIGSNSCTNVTGSNKVCIGARSGPASALSVASDDSKVIYLGDADTTVYIPGTLIVNGTFTANTRFQVGSSIKIAVGSSIASYLEKLDAYGTMKMSDYIGVSRFLKPITDYSLIYSDRRLKNITNENTLGLAKIRQLKVYDFTFKNDKDKKPQVGVIAQDLQKVFPDAVMKDDKGYLKIRQDDMFYAVINAIKELDKTIQQIVEDVKTAIERLNSHDKEIKKLQQENEELKARIEKLEKLVK